MKPLNIKIGDKYDKLTITKFCGNIHRDRCWECQCICGKITIISTSDLRFRKNCGDHVHRLGKNNSHFRGYEEIHKSYWYMLEHNAKKRNLNFDISIKYGWEIFLKQNKKCALTGIPLKFKSKSILYDGTASLDRIDCSKGYVRGNVRWLHKDINVMKNSWNDIEFIELCGQVTDFNRTK